MGKVAQVLIAGYWPDRVPRRVGVPQQSLAKLLDRAAAKSPEALALLTAERRLTVADFYAGVDRLAAGIIASTPPNSTVAVCEPAPDRAVELFAAALLAGCKVTLLDAARPEAVASLLASSPGGPAVAVLTHERGPHSGAWAGEVLDTAELLARGDGSPTTRRAARWRDVALRLPAGDVLVGHSHVSAAAWSTGLTTFIPELLGRDVVWPAGASIAEWDALLAALVALFSGRAIVFAPEAAGWEPRQAWAVLRRPQADAAAGGEVPEWLRQAALVFVLVADFQVRWRRRLENAIGNVLLPLWGAPEHGPAILAHPSWAPLEVHGLPLVNLTMVPVDPTTGEPSEVPWEMLTRAELGVESPGNVVEAPADWLEQRLFTLRGNAVVRTGRSVSVDRLGLLRFED